jgi:hypothetical protein
VDFRRLWYETDCVISLPFFAARLARAALALGTAAALTACDSIKDRLYPGQQVDGAWKRDSTMLASKPTILLRVVRGDSGTRAVPIATIGATGLQALNLTNRGWRALDLRVLNSDRPFVPYRDSDALPPIRAERGMWEGGALDSLAGCQSLYPASKVTVPDGVELLTSGTTPLRVQPNGISGDELQSVLNVVNTLVAPASGVPLSMMSRYSRSVAVVGTGVSPTPTIVVTYEDPEELPDSVTRFAERPRQLILVLDKGVYGYRPTLTIRDVSPTRIAPRRRFLGALDADGDGKSELYFGLGRRIPYGELVTYTYRSTGETWIPDWELTRTRCMR